MFNYTKNGKGVRVRDLYIKVEDVDVKGVVKQSVERPWMPGFVDDVMVKLQQKDRLNLETIKGLRPSLLYRKGLCDKKNIFV